MMAMVTVVRRIVVAWRGHNVRRYDLDRTLDHDRLLRHLLHGICRRGLSDGLTDWSSLHRGDDLLTHAALVQLNDVGDL